MQRNPEVLQKRVRILEMGTAAITGVYARGFLFEKRLNSTRAGWKREFLQAWRAEQDKRDSKRGTRAGREAEESLRRVD